MLHLLGMLGWHHLAWRLLHVWRGIHDGPRLGIHEVEILFREDALDLQLGKVAARHKRVGDGHGKRDRSAGNVRRAVVAAVVEDPEVGIGLGCTGRCLLGGDEPVSSSGSVHDGVCSWCKAGLVVVHLQNLPTRR